MPAKLIRSFAPKADEGMNRGNGTVAADFLRKLRRLNFLIRFCIILEFWSIYLFIVNIQYSYIYALSSVEVLLALGFDSIL